MCLQIKIARHELHINSKFRTTACWQGQNAETISSQLAKTNPTANSLPYIGNKVTQLKALKYFLLRADMKIS